MKMYLAAVGLSVVAASSAHGGEIDFSGSVQIGLIGGSGQAEATVTPYAGLDARAELIWETDGGLTFGVTIPVTTEGTNGGLTVRLSH